jgi:hypothetical protein
LYATLKERGIQAERNFRVDDQGGVYEIPLVIPCNDGRVEIEQSQMPRSQEEVEKLADEIESLSTSRGGVQQN